MPINKKSGSQEHEILPSQLHEALATLKTSTEHLESHVEDRLLRARQVALKVAEQQIKHRTTGLYSFMSFSHPRMVGIGMISICTLFGIGLFQITQPSAQIDTMLLSADLPPEAFVDNAFEPLAKIKEGA